MTDGSNAAVPLISVVTPTYNRCELVLRAVTSVMQQAADSWEMIVVDDGSTDDTVERLQRLAESEPRLALLEQSKQGAAAARMLGAQQARGRYLLFLDSDDELLAGAMDRFRSHLADGCEPGIVCLAAEEFSPEGRHQRNHHPRELGPAYDDFRALFLAGTFLVRRDVFHGCGGFPVTCRSSQHTEFSLRALPYCREHGLEVIAGDDIVLRIHAHAGEHLRSNFQTLLDGGLYIVDTHARQLQKCPKHYADWCMVTAVYAARMNDFALARNLFWRAVRWYPTNVKNVVRLMLASVPPIGRRVWKTNVTGTTV